jgi:hypothetical protein
VLRLVDKHDPPHRRFATGPAQPVPTVLRARKSKGWSRESGGGFILRHRARKGHPEVLNSFAVLRFVDKHDPPHRRFATGPAQPVPTVLRARKSKGWSRESGGGFILRHRARKGRPEVLNSFAVLRFVDKTIPRTVASRPDRRSRSLPCFPLLRIKPNGAPREGRRPFLQ